MRNQKFWARKNKCQTPLKFGFLVDNSEVVRTVIWKMTGDFIGRSIFKKTPRLRAFFVVCPGTKWLFSARASRERTFTKQHKGVILAEVSLHESKIQLNRFVGPVCWFVCHLPPGMTRGGSAKSQHGWRGNAEMKVKRGGAISTMNRFFESTQMKTSTRAGRTPTKELTIVPPQSNGKFKDWWTRNSSNVGYGRRRFVDTDYVDKDFESCQEQTRNFNGQNYFAENLWETNAACASVYIRMREIPHTYPRLCQWEMVSSACV